MRLRKPLEPPAGKTQPSAGPKLSCWRGPVTDGGLRIDLARSPASGYSFIGEHEGAGVLPVLTGNGGTLVGTPDPAAQIEPAMSSQTASRKI